MGSVKIYETRYTEDEITVYDHDGDPVDTTDPPYDDDHTTEINYSDLTASEAAKIISDLGLSFAATGNDWASDPDGSYISDYATGERTERTAHLSDWHPRVMQAIIDHVG